VAKIAAEKGPDPASEFQNLIQQSRQHPKSISWFATWHAANDFRRAGNSTCVLYYHPDDSARVEAVVARILTKADFGLPSEEVKAFYGPYTDRLRNWWPLGGRRPGKDFDIIRTQFDSLGDIPGRSWKSGKSASETFVAQASFAGWEFDSGFSPLDWLQSLTGERP
jgi:hypothetical protein